MKTTSEWISAATAQLNITTYRLAKLLQADTSTVTAYKTGRSVLSEGHAIKLGELMGIDPMPIVAAAAFERSKHEHIKAFWAKHAETVGVVAIGALALGTVILAPTDAHATTAHMAMVAGNSVYYVNRRRYKRTRRVQKWTRRTTGHCPVFLRPHNTPQVMVGISRY